MKDIETLELEIKNLQEVEKRLRHNKQVLEQQLHSIEIKLDKIKLQKNEIYNMIMDLKLDSVANVIENFVEKVNSGFYKHKNVDIRALKMIDSEEFIKVVLFSVKPKAYKYTKILPIDLKMYYGMLSNLESELDEAAKVFVLEIYNLGGRE